MNIQQITEMMINSGIEEKEARKEIKMLLEHFCNYTEMDKIRGIQPDEMQLSTLMSRVEERLVDRKPIQHVIGEAYFMGEFFKITKDVLIPRDETEILVRKAIEIIKENNFKEVLDIGTGSGCIACTIAKLTKATVLGIDISSDALRIALDNVTRLGINNRAVFRKSDIFSKIRDDEKFDVIVSNPPYIPYGTALEPEVMHEPKIALFAPDNGLSFYKEIVKNAPKYLKTGGYLLFELGIGEAEEVKKLLCNDFDDINLIKDLSGIDRVIYGRSK